MIHLNLILDTRRKKQNDTYPIVFRLSFNKQTRDIKTGYSCKPIDWNQKSGKIKETHTSFDIRNPKLKELEAGYLKRIAEIERKNEVFVSVQDLKEALVDERNALANVYDFWNAEIVLLKKANRAGNSLMYTKRHLLL